MKNFKKIFAVIMAIVLALGCAGVAGAETTEARSNTVSINVRAYKIEAGNTGANADKNTNTDKVMTSGTTNRTGYDNVVWSFSGIDKDDVSGATFEITAGEILAGVTESCTKKVTVTAEVTNADGSKSSAGSAVLTYKIIWAGQNIDEDEEKTIDTDDTKKTTGDFTVKIDAPTLLWPGEPCTYSCTYEIANNLAALINDEGVTYKVYVADNNTVIAEVYTFASGNANVAVEGHTYKIWAVGTLTYSVKSDAPNVQE